MLEETYLLGRRDVFGKGSRENVREVDRKCFGRRECVEKGSREMFWKKERIFLDVANVSRWGAVISSELSSLAKKTDDATDDDLSSEGCVSCMQCPWFHLGFVLFDAKLQQISQLPPASARNSSCLVRALKIHLLVS